MTNQTASRLTFTALLAALAAPAVAAPAKKTSGADQRKEVSITVYNQNFGLVREVRDLELGQGDVALEFRDVAARIQPETVAIRSLSAATGLTVLEQNYRFDLLTPAKLLEKHVGRKVRLHRYSEKLGKEDSFDAKLLSVADGQPVYEIGGEVTYGFPGRVSFPSVPDNLMSKPTLVWLVDSKQPKQRVEVTYLTQSMNWKADYVFVIDDKDTTGDLTGWVTLTNQSGTSYEGAKLKLVAGDVQRVSQPSGRGRSVVVSSAPAADRGFQQESFFEYHLYTLQQPTDVLENEQKQVTLLEAKSAKVLKKLIYFGQQYWYRGQYGEIQKNQKVGVYLDLENTKQNKLGIPLPAGIVRVYKADKSGAKQFIGEDRIDHTPRDEKIRIKMGEAFDVVGDRKQMAWRTLGGCQSESDWEIELRNHKDKAESVEIFEPIGGDWTILQSSHTHKKRDAFTFTFDVNVPARGKVKVTYKVRVRWC
ncbi:MAG: DUF4139 domain-containing protein [Polyangiaceae bacterium]|nr:DUF4139 domain-containing protein [Polyangiaceae bacterium]